MRLLIWLVVNALALGAATWLLDGITLDGSSDSNKLVALLIVGAIFGLITSFVRPIVRLLSLPFIIITLGLMLFVINAFMLLFTSWIAEQLDLGFHVDGFWTALWGSIVISIASVILESLFPHPRS